MSKVNKLFQISDRNKKLVVTIEARPAFISKVYGILNQMIIIEEDRYERRDVK